MNENFCGAAIAQVGKGVGFERLRRITGYIGALNRWNDAKKAEERERLKHTARDTK